MSEQDEIQVSDQPEDGVEPLENGKFRIWIDGIPYTLRRPRFGEYKDYRLRLTEAPSDGAEVLDFQVSWMRDVFGALGDRKLPDDENDWPVWLPVSNLAGQMLVHWRSVPLARGDQSAENSG